MKRFLSLLVTLLLAFSCALAEEDPVIATVNGEELRYSEYLAIESAYLYQYESAGVDMSNPQNYAYVQDLALTYAIEQILVRQDMHAQGCYDFDEETEAWFAETGKAAYNAALKDVMDALRSPDMSEDEVLFYALAYAQSLGVTEQTYVDYFRDQYASARYHDWLIRDNPVTEADVKAAYDARVAESQALYANDIPGFETAMTNGTEVWYKPAGYRSVLQILLPAQGSTPEERLQSVQPVVDEIQGRLARGESFLDLIAEYGTDANCANEAFLSVGYQVHPDSVVWEDAFVAAVFSPEMAQPGSVSAPFASTLGVHILYYLGDSPAGPVELTQEVYDALYYTLYTERYSEAQAQRITELANAAEIVIY
ncbi:MAG: hypothetical protein IKL25_10490 [Clostridia bacterium]|nr:hypothetical protein [Clostridia bacterium]